ncbi:MAG: 2-phosphosulfolactate phosphatase [Verrucomicrobiales bacterium]|nr:2-phosphosulfolactate phosphatase [Verrucomicrobiales bacterium]MCP5527031.1 2-phosphosulfolactate phosphatase [Verrucomicrobiales bacterium]
MPNPSSLDVLLSPAEFDRLPRLDLRSHTCVVFDVLRATSSMVTALANGADAILPVIDIESALAVRQARPDALLAGERHGWRIGARLTGGVEFDLGNSPREFTPEAVRGRTIIMTTTNGTRALQACAGAHAVYVGAFSNLSALVEELRRVAPRKLLVICSGTFEEASLEDTLAAGALVDALWPGYEQGAIGDGAQIARCVHQQLGTDPLAAMHRARNGRRLLEQPALSDDVSFSLRRDSRSIVPRFEAGAVSLPPRACD